MNQQHFMKCKPLCLGVLLMLSLSLVYVTSPMFSTQRTTYLISVSTSNNNKKENETTTGTDTSAQQEEDDEEKMQISILNPVNDVDDGHDSGGGVLDYLAAFNASVANYGKDNSHCSIHIHGLHRTGKP